MEFDHRDGKKHRGQSVMGAASWGMGEIKKELEKCDIVCGNCHNIRTQSRITHPECARQNSLYVRKLRETTPCKDCGKQYPWPAMEFDHVTGEKYGCISTLAGKNGTTALMEEIAKCEIVCRNCHILRTFVRANEHGKWKTR